MATEPEVDEIAAPGATSPGSEGDGQHWDYERRKCGRWPPLGLRIQELREMTATGARNPESEGDG
jgi:hypothetical protein